jgi:hypothetical protein
MMKKSSFHFSIGNSHAKSEEIECHWLEVWETKWVGNLLRATNQAQIKYRAVNMKERKKE